MRIGHARYCISPKQEFYLIGYRSDNRMYPASGIHDDIYCQSLLFENNGQMLFLFSADFLEFEEEMAEDVKTLLADQFGIERDCVLLSATHNHSSVVSYHKSWYTGKFNQGYYDYLIKMIIKSFQDCLVSLQTAYAKYGKANIYGYYGNRNHPGQPADNEVIVVKFYNENHEAFAGIVNWAVHSTVISGENTYLTSELAGHVCQCLYDEFKFYPIMMVGAAGDCSNRNERQGNDFIELERVAPLLASDIAQIDVSKTIQLKEIKCQTLFHTIHHDMSFVHDELRDEIMNMEKQLERENQQSKKDFLMKKINNLKTQLDIHAFHLDAKASVIQLGDLQIFVFPGELGSAFGIQMKKECPVLGLICGYTNGYYEYFMPESEYGLSFETMGCAIPKGEPEKLVQKFIQASKLLNGEG